jgi:hypothetical protein
MGFLQRLQEGAFSGNVNLKTWSLDDIHSSQRANAGAWRQTAGGVTARLSTLLGPATYQLVKDSGDS